MTRRISEELEVKVPASEAWKVYGTLKLANMVLESLPGVISKIDVVQGDGGVGTILQIFFTPGTDGRVSSYKEKFTVVDDEKRVKVAEVVEGGYLDMGFRSYQVRLEVIDKEKECCITRSTIEYEVMSDDEANGAAHLLVSIQPLVTIMQKAAKHLLQNYNNINTTTN